MSDILPVIFDKAAVKIEHREFLVDSDLDCTQSDATKFWLNIYNIKSPMGAYKYRNLATIALRLLSISTSNAYCERVFNQVRRVKN